MKPEMEVKATYGFWGMVVGAGIAITIGFMWGGWATSNTALKRTDEAVLASRAAICVAQFMNGPNHELRIKEFQGTDTYKRSDLVEKEGSDKMPGQDKADYGVARACVTGLEALVKT